MIPDPTKQLDRAWAFISTGTEAVLFVAVIFFAATLAWLLWQMRSIVRDMTAAAAAERKEAAAEIGRIRDQHLSDMRAMHDANVKVIASINQPLAALEKSHRETVDRLRDYLDRPVDRPGRR